ncbi:unannotated protein [freshwater metagenome]|uniref:histidine kinase n=1 Tax=freshwater metagenome TaxID=449393 RepID=A0A6J7IGR0_9ZZZZ|nr:hypothetical protein [Actinomycetota bacterium]
MSPGRDGPRRSGPGRDPLDGGSAVRRLRLALGGDVRQAQSLFRLLAAVAVGALLLGEIGEPDFTVLWPVPLTAGGYVLLSAVLLWPRRRDAGSETRDRRRVLTVAVLDVVAVCAVALAISEPRTGVLLMLAAVVLGSGMTLRGDAVAALTGIGVVACLGVWAANPLYETPGVADRSLVFLVLALAWSGLVARQISMERLRRAERIEALSSSVRDMLRQSLDAGADERARVADLLHDDVLQLLLVTQHDIADAIDGELDLLPDARAGVESATRRLRETIAALRAEGRDDELLGEALRDLAGDVGPDRPVGVEVQVARGLDGVEHPVLVAVARDVVRDAASTAPRGRIVVTADREGDDVVLRVRHEDRRFAFGTAAVDPLGTVVERIRAVDGTLAVDRPADGDERVVTVRVPLRTDARVPPVRTDTAGHGPRRV